MGLSRKLDRGQLLQLGVTHWELVITMRESWKTFQIPHLPQQKNYTIIINLTV